MSVLKLTYKGQTYNISFQGNVLLGDLLSQKGITGYSPCGGMGKCGKCAVAVNGDISAPTNAELNANTRLACQTTLYGDASATLLFTDESFANALSATDNVTALTPDNGYALAVDIGTTTVVASLYRGNGTYLATQWQLNPQRSIASDVMGRLSAALYGKAGLLNHQITQCVTQLINKLCQGEGITASALTNCVITGNTSMLYLLAGVPVKSVATAPFVPKTLFDCSITNPVNAYIPPCINAFVGADITCGLIAVNMCNNGQTALLCDMGTNGELALWKNGKLYVTSAAAGPAFEGAELSCGCGYINGAINKVWVENGAIKAQTVGNAPAIGLCGSGLIDAISAFIQLGYIDNQGNTASDLTISANGGGVTVTQADIRNLQLAKSAVRSAIQVLLAQTDTTVDEIQKFYLAGGFGSGISPESAQTIGLIPNELAAKLYCVGNTALKGGAMLALNKPLRQAAAELVKNAVHITLGGNADFNSEFIKNINF